tara:strand:- start:8404 stop:8664 length:261 start_codon:yes stop_codon:yes gene_type:complete
MQNSFRPIQELKNTPHTHSSEVEREPVHQKLIELSRAEGLLKSLEYFNEKDMMDKDDTERIVKDALDRIREVRDYIQDNYQQLRTY